MTKLTYPKEESGQAKIPSEVMNAASAAEQILHLKRLLVTLKQQYEKGLQDLQQRLQAEQAQKQTLKKELEGIRLQEEELKKQHEEELNSLREQQAALRDLLKKTQEELKQQRDQAATSSQSDPDLLASRQRVEQLERVIPYLRERTEESHLETEQLREELEKNQKKSKALEADFIQEKQQYQQEIEHLRQLLSLQEEKRPEFIASHTSSYQLRQELEIIKQTLVQGSQETKALEARYVEVLKEKVSLEYQVKQLQTQLEHQSSNLMAFQENMQEFDHQKKALEVVLQEKERQLVENGKLQVELKEQLRRLEDDAQAKVFIQEKYEQLKEEWEQLSRSLEEAVEARLRAEQELEQVKALIQGQDCHLAEKGEQLFQLSQEKESLEVNVQQLRALLDESESRLKVAQQHLAKKVKEAAMLTEKVEEQQLNLEDLFHMNESFKEQFSQLQASVELYQKQEKRLQDQLNEALKGTEVQVSKWEEKYFRMYDKWQESENRIRELRKFEEKHHQMQSLLANLGNFMGTSFPSSGSLFQSMQEMKEKGVPSRSNFFDTMQEMGQAAMTTSKPEPLQEKSDLFGMQTPQDKCKANNFS